MFSASGLRLRASARNGRRNAQPFRFVLWFESQFKLFKLLFDLLFDLLFELQLLLFKLLLLQLLLQLLVQLLLVLCFFFFFFFLFTIAFVVVVIVVVAYLSTGSTGWRVSSRPIDVFDAISSAVSRCWSSSSNRSGMVTLCVE